MGQRRKRETKSDGVARRLHARVWTRRLPPREHTTQNKHKHKRMTHTHSPYHDVSAQHAEANAVSEQNSLAPGRVETLQVALVQVL